MSLINVGLFAEGSTDLQFLQPVVSKAIEKMVYSCPGLILFQVFPIRIPKTELGFAEQVLEASKDGVQKFGMTILLVRFQIGLS